MFVIYSLAVISYLVVGVYLYTSLTTSRPTHKAMSLIGLITGAVFHAILLYPNIVTRYGLNFNIFNAISLTALFFLLFFVLFSLYRPILSLGVLAVPTAIIGMSFGQFGQTPYQPLSNTNTGLQAHILLSFGAYCVLLMACVQAILLKLQIRELKRHTQQRFWVSKLPNLQSMESLLFDMILMGFVLLSIALSLGFMATYDVMEQHVAHKLFFSVLSWVVFGVFLIGHYKQGWRGNRACNFTIYGFVLLAMGFLGSKTVLELILS